MSSKPCNNFRTFLSMKPQNEAAYLSKAEKKQRGISKSWSFVTFISYQMVLNLFQSERKRRKPYDYIDLIVIGIFILIPSEIVGAETRKGCPTSRQTIQTTSFCPQNEHEWDVAAEKMGCADIEQDCTKKDNFLYHCILREFVYIEVCAPKTKIIGGYCPTFDPVGEMVVENFKSDCKNHSNPCPDVFESSEAYRRMIKINIFIFESEIFSFREINC
ncbi:uncharacterized protein LOC133178733 [Saccostrea echinata]|uniref:uncharacterized protein LOC133178733 n=1 Tax=Saccostrea echinata TaxID=191078 RepID=UPI002A7EDC58|nr:uncharacterized protein LOC133178733 [Saccostrea echinata]